MSELKHKGWLEIKDYRVYGAFDFLTYDELKNLVDKNKNKYPILKKGGSIHQVDELIQIYGSDYDLIDAVLSEKYSPPDFFYILDFIQDSKYCEDYFRIRVWKAPNLIEDDPKISLWATYPSEIQLIFERLVKKKDRIPRKLTKDEIEDVIYKYKKGVEYNMDNWTDILEEAIEEVIDF